MNKIELLAPAGNLESLKKAIEAGADSVYFGTDDFNARRQAENINSNNIKKAIEHCHENGIKAYLTMNTLIKNSEISRFFNALMNAYNSGIDAVIIQHLSFVPIIRKNFPELKIHISTQGNLENYHSINNTNADRVILPRELSLEEIKTIKKNTNIELEIFVHGAVCFSYSGQCLMSSMIGGRSGNRGLCAQPCRRMYNGTYLMSTKDLCLINEIPKIIEAGVSCIKIEGRMRSPEYVFTVTSIYRNAIEKYYNNNFHINENEIKSLKKAFNREFTQGLLMNKKDTIAAEKPMDRGLYLGTYNNGMLRLEEDIKQGMGVGIWKKDKVVGSRINYISLYGNIVEVAKKGAIVKINLDAENGDKIYLTSKEDIKNEIIINENIVRNKVIINRKKVLKYSLPKIEDSKYTGTKVFIKVHDIQGMLDALKFNPEIIYYNIDKEDVMDAKKKCTTKFFLYLPRILTDEQIINYKKKIDEIKPDGILASNFGILNQNYITHIDYNLNIFNDIDLWYFKKYAILSPELNLNEINNFKKTAFVFVHGDLIVMATKQPIKEGVLKDEKEIEFVSEKQNGYSVIYNSSTLGFFDEILKLKPKYLFFDLKENVYKTLSIYDKIIKGEKVNTSKVRRGHTVGHLFRGVK